MPHVMDATHIHHNSLQFVNDIWLHATQIYKHSETVSVEALISTVVLLYLPSLLVYVLFSQVAASMCF